LNLKENAMPGRLAADDPYLLSDLKRDEGLRLKAYVDTVGVVTIGYGHAYVPKGTVWTQTQAEDALRKDIALHMAELDAHEPWWRRMSLPRQRVLANMAFNLGIKRLQGFHNTLAAMQAGRYGDAAAGMRASLWAKQTGKRAERLALQMDLG